MIKIKSLQSMASLYKGLPGLIKHDTIPRKILTFNHSQGSRRINVTNIGFNLKGCADFCDKVPNLKSKVPNLKNNEDVFVNGFYQTKAIALSNQPLSEFELQLQEENRGSSGILDSNGGACEIGGSTSLQEGSSLPEKIVVAVDVDEVLGNFVSALNRFIADRYASNHSVSEYHVYEFFKIWNCSRDEADVRVHEFFKTPYFKDGIHPLPGAQKTLEKLSSFCSLSVVTSRQNVIKDHTLKWLNKHFPGLFKQIHFGNHFALDGESKPKSEICRSMGAQVLIDDNPRYALECAEVGIRVLLFDYENSYPWCKTESEQHPLVTKVHCWDEVEQQLTRMYSSPQS